MRPLEGRWLAALGGRLTRGSAMIESALSLPIVLMVTIGLVQFAVYYHAQNVFTGAVQDGARVAASADGTLQDGVNHTNELLQAGIGQTATNVNVQGLDGQDEIAIQATGHLRLLIPWVADATLPLDARAVMSKEHFRVGPAR